MNHFSTISPLEAFKQAFPWYEPKVNKENLTYAFGCSRIATKAYRRAIRVIIEKGLPLSVILETTWINEYVFDISMTVFLVPEEYTFADEVQDDEVYQEEKAEWR